MVPIAFSLQLILDEHKRLQAEVEIVYENGSTTLRHIPVNEKLTIFFEDLVPDTNPPDG